MKLAILFTILCSLVNTAGAEETCYTIEDYIDAKLGELEVSLTARIEALENVPNSISMKYSLTGNKLVSMNGIVLWDSIMSDTTGDAYNATSGIFTAPVDGHYLFGLKACSEGGAYDHYHVRTVADDKTIAFTLSGDMTYNSCSSDIGAKYLTAGSEVWVKRISGTKTTGVLRVHSSFTVVLL